MNLKKELIKKMRIITSAGIADCATALEESNFDLEKAVDAVKAKGLSNTARAAGKVTAEGVIKIVPSADGNTVTLCEINCQTDFVAKSEDFNRFADAVATCLSSADLTHFRGDLAAFRVPTEEANVIPDETMEDARKSLIATTKENVVVRRWWRMEVAPGLGALVTYLHTNSKVGVAVSLEVAQGLLESNEAEIRSLGEDIAMQIAAMSPVAVSRDSLPEEEVDRQRAIFEAQLNEANKPQAAWPKIMDGKFNKWYADVCLVDQESVVTPKTPKTSIGQLLKNLSAKLGGDVTVLNFVRASVGEGVEVHKENFADEVAKMSGVGGFDQGGRKDLK